MANSIAEGFAAVFSGYRDLLNQRPGGQYPVTKVLTKELPLLIRQKLGLGDGYLVEGSWGRGGWTYYPCVSIFDRLITESAQSGFYIVYLFRSDMAGVYLSLNQGVTEIKAKYKVGASEVLMQTAADFKSQLGEAARKPFDLPVDLKVLKRRDAGDLYGNGNICATYYSRESLPNDARILQDLRAMMALYTQLRIKAIAPLKDTDHEEDESEDEKTNLKLRTHKRYERNRKLAVKAKKIHGYTCQICHFNFEAKYGAHGHEYIEAHHKTPFHLLSEGVRLNPKEDFAVVCSNCHRMLHRRLPGLAVQELKDRLLP
jgi:5-methylcytosine-specific restriction protein A